MPMYVLLVLERGNKEEHVWEEKGEISAKSRRQAVAHFASKYPLRPVLSYENVKTTTPEGIDITERVNVMDNGLFGRWAVRMA